MNKSTNLTFYISVILVIKTTIESKANKFKLNTKNTLKRK
jgi:hypothetical protein